MGEGRGESGEGRAERRGHRAEDREQRAYGRGEERGEGKASCLAHLRGIVSKRA